MTHTTPDAKIICNSTLGVELDETECAVLAKIMDLRQLNDGDYVVKEGEANKCLCLLAEGKLIVNSRIEDKETDVYVMQPGECAGTRSFIDHAPRRATLKAKGPATVYGMDPQKFESLLAAHPHIVYKVMRALFRITHANLMRMNVETRELTNYIHKTGGRY